MSDRLVAEPVGETMTIGELSQRTGVPVKRLRRYEERGFIYTVGRSAGNYRVFDESALWCVNLVTTMRSLGLTLKEIDQLVEVYLTHLDVNVGPRLAEALRDVRRRTLSRIAELEQLVSHIDAFTTEYRAELDGTEDFRKTDPRATKS